MTIGEKIKQARMQRGVSQRELAKRLYVTPPTLAHWESGVRKPKKETLERIASALGMQAEDIMQESEVDKLDRDYLSPNDLPTFKNSIGGLFYLFGFSPALYEYLTPSEREQLHAREREIVMEYAGIAQNRQVSEWRSSNE